MIPFPTDRKFVPLLQWRQTDPIPFCRLTTINEANRLQREKSYCIHIISATTFSKTIVLLYLHCKKVNHGFLWLKFRQERYESKIAECGKHGSLMLNSLFYLIDYSPHRYIWRILHHATRCHSCSDPCSRSHGATTTV